MKLLKKKTGWDTVEKGTGYFVHSLGQGEVIKLVCHLNTFKWLCLFFWFILCISLDGRIFLSCEAPFLCLVLFQNSAGAALGGCETFKELDQAEKQVIRDGSLKVTQMIWGFALCSWPMPWWEATAAYCLTMERDFRCHHLSSMINCSPSKTMSQNGYPFSLPKQDHQLRPKNILNPDLLKLLLILWKEIEVPTFTIPLGLSS